MKGRINSFQSLGTVDGPGVRSVVFMQGCPLRCICCHNPETWCLSGGEETTADELIKKIIRFKPYFGAKGGVTVSGGEPPLQAEFVLELFEKLKALGINTALATSGCVLNGTVTDLLDVTDLVILDHKYSSAADYKAYTGASLEKTEEFLAAVNKKGVTVWLRRVIIPEINNSEESVNMLVSTAKKFGCVKKVELLPFRNFCIEKYDNLNMEFKLKNTPPLSAQALETLNALIPDEYK